MSTIPKRFTIGRNKECDVPIADDSVSRLHAELTVLDGGKLSLADRDSSNGTALIRQGKSQAIREVVIQVTDRVRFGAVELSVKDLLDAISHKNPGLRLENIPGYSVSSPPPQGNRLVRCACGAIKPSEGRCPACGE